LITKAKSRDNAGQLADYLLHEEPGEHVEVAEMRGFAATSLRDAAIEMEMLASGGRAENPFYHMQVRCAPGENLTREQWLDTADRMEAALGLGEHQRWVVFHELDGERHLHVVWNRVHPETLKSAHMGHDYAKRMEVARELEIEFALRRVPFQGRTATFNQSEMEQARRQDADPAEIREAIREAWQQADSGMAFASALDERGFMLAKGDRRDFVAVDAFGCVHSIGKRTTGATAAEVRARLADINPERLLDVEQARGLLEYAQAELTRKFNEQGEEGDEGRASGGESKGGQGRDVPPIETLRAKQEREQRRHDLLQRREARRTAAILKSAQADAEKRDRKPTTAEARTNPASLREWKERQADRTANTRTAIDALQERLTATRDAFAARHAAQVEMMKHWLRQASTLAAHWKEWLADRAEVATEAVRRGQEWAMKQHIRTARQNRTDTEMREMLESLPPEQRAKAEAQIKRQSRDAKRKAEKARKQQPGLVNKPDMRSDVWKFDR